jgi:hypothetical protein
LDQLLDLSVERAKGIEPSYAAWEAAVLPLNYARQSPAFFYLATILTTMRAIQNHIVSNIVRGPGQNTKSKRSMNKV